MSISAKQVSKYYGAQAALNEVSFELKEGQIVGFLGPNGAGKSTMMKIITCYLPQSSGQVSVCGYDVVSEAEKVKPLVGYLPEHNPLYHDMYVKEYLTFVAGLHKAVGTKTLPINEVIQLVGLEVEQHKKIGALSKGYKQRVGLAQAIIHEPKVLILDEPTSGFDPNQIVEIRKLIQTLGKDKTVMMSTHIMQEVEALCNRVIIINKGKIIADQTVDQLKHATQDVEAVFVEFAQSIAEQELAQLPQVIKVEGLGQNKFICYSKGSEDIRAALFNWAVQTGNQVITIRKEEQKLEDVFKTLTNK